MKSNKDRVLHVVLYENYTHKFTKKCLYFDPHVYKMAWYLPSWVRFYITVLRCWKTPNFYRKWFEFNYQLTSAFVFCWYAKSISVHVQIIDRNMNRTNNIHSLFWWKCFFEMKYSQYSIISLSSWIAENVANTHTGIYNLLSNIIFERHFLSFAMVNGIISTINSCLAFFIYFYKW